MQAIRYKIRGSDVCLCTLMIGLQCIYSIHITSKNFISNCLHHVILFNIFNIL